MKKKGFTLIELLAVLVVLAILALITIPLVIGIIKNAREKANERSIEAYGRAVENAVGVYLLTNPKADYNMIGSLYNKDTQKIGNVNIEYTGRSVTCNSLNVSNTGLIILKGCQVSSSDKSYKYENKRATEEIYKEYSVGDEIQIEGDTSGNYYRVIAPSGIKQDYVVAIGYPIYRDMYSLFSSTDFATQIANDNSENTHMYLRSAYLYSDTCKYEGDISGCSSDYDNSSIKQVVNIWAENTFTDQLKEVDGYKARLIKIEELEELGYIKEEDYYIASENVPRWIKGEYSYMWTMSPYVNSNNETSTSRIFYKYAESYGYGVEDCYAHCKFSVSPVINVYKDKLPE